MNELRQAPVPAGKVVDIRSLAREGEKTFIDLADKEAPPKRAPGKGLYDIRSKPPGARANPLSD